MSKGARVFFAWFELGAGDALTAKFGAHVDLQRFRSLEGDGGCGYVFVPEDPAQAAGVENEVRAAWAGAEFSRLSMVMDIAGTSFGATAPYHYIVRTDVRPEQEADFNAWYDREHLTGLASVPGTARARRYRDLDGHPRYHACYDLVRAETLGSAPWLAVRATCWSNRVRPGLLNTTRAMFRAV